ncbi:MAG: hypothetical protein E7208_06125 [Clostridium butyricum]|nr:hypothetical protein [Clostridium butyricum]
MNKYLNRDKMFRIYTYKKSSYAVIMIISTKETSSSVDEMGYTALFKNDYFMSTSIINKSVIAIINISHGNNNRDNFEK